MHIGLSGPIATQPLLQLLGETGEQSNTPNGLAMTPVVNLAQELVALGHKVTIFTLDPSVSKTITVEGPKLRIYFCPYRSRARDRAKDFFKQERSLLVSAMLAESPDILHAHWTYEYALAAQASRLPTVITAHDAPFSVVKFYRHPYRWIRLAMAMAAINSASHITTVSPYVTRHIQRYFVTRARITTVPNGIKVGSRKLNAQLGHASALPIRYTTVLQDWSRRKNPTAAIEAFYAVRSMAPKSELHMFGSDYGNQGPASEWINKQPHREGIHLHGPTDYSSLLDFHSRYTDVLVHPALEESFCMAALEAMNLQIPVIGGKNSGALPWVVGSSAGMLLDVNDPSAIAAAMLRLGKSKSMRLNMGIEGSRRVDELFTLHSVVHSYLEEYDIAIGTRELKH